MVVVVKDGWISKIQIWVQRPIDESVSQMKIWWNLCNYLMPVHFIDALFVTLVWLKGNGPELVSTSGLQTRAAASGAMRTGSLGMRDLGPAEPLDLESMCNCGSRKGVLPSRCVQVSRYIKVHVLNCFEFWSGAFASICSWTFLEANSLLKS